MNRTEMIKEQVNLVCIQCPRGCVLCVSQEADSWKVKGNTCARGPAYAIQEVTDPMRVITALMRLTGTDIPVSVKTDRPVPKAQMMNCVKEMYSVRPPVPVHCGDVLIENLCGTGANVVATRDSE